MASSRVPGMTRRAKVAPYNSCICCYQGDTSTGVLFSGQAEYVIAGLAKLLDSVEEASATAGVGFEEQGFDSGKAPTGRVESFVRLCRDCAREKGLPAEAIIEEAAARDGEVPGFYQLDEDFDEGGRDDAS